MKTFITHIGKAYNQKNKIRMPSKGGRRMNLEQAIQTLSHHQKWRLGIEENMIHETKTLT